ncbi:MAG: methyl-accepting chemotaxis protein [Parachlamydia sp.]|nr:methyl-accepting chemotaxis protein [Parachlamydia sp.]
MALFSLRQFFYLILVLASLVFAPLLYLSIANYLEDNTLLSSEIQGNRYQNLLKQLIHSLLRHQVIISQVYKGKTDPIKLDHSKKQIDIYFSDLVKYPLDDRFNPVLAHARAAEQKWNLLKNEKLAIENSAAQYQDATTDIQHAFSSMRLIAVSPAFALFNQLALLQSILNQAVDEFSANEELLPEKKTAFYALIEAIMHDLKFQLNHAAKTDKNFLVSPALIEVYDQYFSAIENFFKHQAFSSKAEINAGALSNQGYQVIFLGLKAWDQTTTVVAKFLREQEEALDLRFWTLLLLSVFFFTLLLILVTLGFQHMKRALNEIGSQAQLLSEGQPITGKLATLPIEMDVIAKPLNKLSVFQDEVLYNYKELVRGIHAVFNGDLNIRLQSPSQSKNYTEPLLLFNGMVEDYDGLIRRLQELGFMLTNSASQLTMAIMKQETIIKENETTSGQIAVAANEIFLTAKDFAASFKETTNTAQETSNLASKGKESLGKMEGIMKLILDASGSIADKLAILNEKAGNITGVVTTITKVVEQTHLLSLNASIEAEKAGEFGKSFAIIAREIRRLSDQTGSSAHDIKKMINEIMTALSSSVMGMDDFTKDIKNGTNQVSKVGLQLSQIIEQVQVLIRNLQFINEGMQAQSEGAEQINVAITNLSSKAIQTTDSIHEFRDTIDELSTASNELRTLMPHVKKFRQ